MEGGQQAGRQQRRAWRQAAGGRRAGPRSRAPNPKALLRMQQKAGLAASTCHIEAVQRAKDRGRGGTRGAELLKGTGFAQERTLNSRRRVSFPETQQKRR